MLDPLTVPICAPMADRRPMAMNQDLSNAAAAAADGSDDEDYFFESCDRIPISPAAASISAAAGIYSSSDDDEFDDSRMSFTSAISAFSSAPTENNARCSFTAVAAAAAAMAEGFSFWTGEAGSIEERRRRLLKGMGYTGDKEHLRLASNSFSGAASNKIKNCKVSPPEVTPPSAAEKSKPDPSPSPSPSSSPSALLVRSRSEGDIGALYVETERQKHMIGKISKQRLTRTYSSSSHRAPLCSINANSIRNDLGDGGGCGNSLMRKRGSRGGAGGSFSSFFLIKNLDTGKEFIVNEYDQHGMWNRLSDLQTGKQLTMEEFEKCVGYSPVVKELMRRESASRIPVMDDMGSSGERKAAAAANSYLSKSYRYSKRRGVAFLKNIKDVANSMSVSKTEKEREHNSLVEHKPGKLYNPSPSKWTKVRQHGKSHKELTALHLSQEIQAHDGSIWAIRFSPDARYLASAGEDRVIHVWEVQECEITSMRLTDELGCPSPHLSPLASSSSDQASQSEAAACIGVKEKKRKGKNSCSSRKGNLLPDYIYEPESIFSLSEKPACSFNGHLDDVLDLSWSKSQLLLSSSMDKTVRLWELETKSCLRLFAHNDYVTCISFNPVDDNYFISGSLDAKLRLWSIPDRQVIDWSDLHEMVTAACYTPDGQGAIAGSHQGNCRLYSITDCKLSPSSQFDIHSKKKSHARKITGFQVLLYTISKPSSLHSQENQFAPGNNTSEVLITSADSRIRIYDTSETEMVSKFKGYRNTSSQISASFTPDGKYIICASEDSHVYLWRRPEDPRNGSTASATVGAKGKAFANTKAYEHFPCRDVSAAVPWHGTVKGESPPPPAAAAAHSKRHSKRSSSAPPSSPSSPTASEERGLLGRSHSNSVQQLPPLPRKSSKCLDADPSGSARVDSGVGAGSESFNSAAPSSGRYAESLSTSGGSGNFSSASWSTSWSVSDMGNSHRSGGQHAAGTAVKATAWGMVMVTATLGGEIRAYQNFGLPVRISRRQTNLFNGA